MASNIWGLFYYVSGPIGTLIFCFIYLCFVFYLNLLVTKESLSAHLIPGAMFLCFYASRIEIGAITPILYLHFSLLSLI